MRFLIDLILRFWRYILVFVAISFVILISILNYNKDSDVKSDIIIADNKINESTSLTSNESKNEKENIIKVDVKGYIKKPGVYEISDDARVNDVIKLAGGLKSGADTSNINLSKRLKDEMVIIIPKKVTKKTSNNSSKNTDDESETITNDAQIVDTDKNEIIINKDDETSLNPNLLVSLNKSTKEELMTLDGIGESKAQNIIDYRNITPFKKIEDLLNINGIGESIFEKIKDKISI